MLQRLVPLAALAALSTGCAINQTVKPVERLADKQVCIITNPAVREGFMVSFKQALETKGYVARPLPSSASIVDCQVTSTYTANWRWDLAMYMSYADIKVYNGGKVIGEANYDATRGGMNAGKFIEADKKIRELVDQLFPGGAGL